MQTLPNSVLRAQHLNFLRTFQSQAQWSINILARMFSAISTSCMLLPSENENQVKEHPHPINRSCAFHLPRLILCFSPERIPGVSITLMLSSTALGSWAHTNLKEKKKRRDLTTKWHGIESWAMFRAGISLPHQFSSKHSTELRLLGYIFLEQNQYCNSLPAVLFLTAICMADSLRHGWASL